MSERVVIIGGGIAGLTAGYLLHKKYDITLFEQEQRIGGNAYTLETKNGEEIDVSIFFYSRLEYPNFCKLLDKIGIPSRTRPMEGLSECFHNLDTGKSYYLSCDCRKPGLILRPVNVRSFFHQMRAFHFYRRGIALARAGRLRGLTLAEALAHLPGLQGDTLKFAVFPICVMTSMFWRDLMNAPAEFVFAKIEKQCGTPRKFMSWRLMPCKTRDYMEKLAEPFRDRIRLGSRIVSVGRRPDSVTVQVDNGERMHCDRVVFACPADTALALLEEPTEEERRLLGVWRYTDGLVMVHRDRSNYPPEKLWGLYGYLYRDRGAEVDLSINAFYRFQNGVPDDSEYIGIQHPNFEIDENLVEFRKVFRTPLYDARSTAVIRELPSLNGKFNTYYCGSYFGYGLHEDAVTSAIEVGRMLGAEWD